MPQTVIEYTDNLDLNTNELIQKMNKTLVEQLPTVITECKSRFIKLSDYYIGDNNNLSFIHVTLHALPTRTKEVFEKTAKALIVDIKNVTSGQEVQISVAVQMLPELYFKA